MRLRLPIRRRPAAPQSRLVAPIELDRYNSAADLRRYLRRRAVLRRGGCIEAVIGHHGAPAGVGMAWHRDANAPCLADAAAVLRDLADRLDAAHDPTRCTHP